MSGINIHHYSGEENSRINWLISTLVHVRDKKLQRLCLQWTFRSHIKLQYFPGQKLTYIPTQPSIRNEIPTTDTPPFVISSVLTLRSTIVSTDMRDCGSRGISLLAGWTWQLTLTQVLDWLSVMKNGLPFSFLWFLVLFPPLLPLRGNSEQRSATQYIEELVIGCCQELTLLVKI